MPVREDRLDDPDCVCTPEAWTVTCPVHVAPMSTGDRESWEIELGWRNPVDQEALRRELMDEFRKRGLPDR